MGLADTARLAARLDLEGNFSSKLGGAEKALGSFSASAGRVGKGVGQVAGGLVRLGAIAAGAATTGLIAAAKTAGDFEAQLRIINTIARENAEGLGAIGDGIRKLARDTGAPLEELTQGYYDLLSAGIDAADAQGVLTQANTLAIGGLSTSAEAVDLLTTAINVYGGDASKAAQFTDEFAKAIERGKVTAADLAASYAQVAPLAKELGVENKELAAGFATLTAGGTAAGEASTQMASALTALLKKTPGLEALEKATKKNYVAIAGDKGLVAALQEMRTDAEKAGVGIEELVGRKEALLFILQTTGPNLQKYNADLAAMGDAAGTAAEQMAERQQGLNFQLGRLRANITDAAISIGSGFTPALSRMADRLSSFISDNQVELENFGKDIGKAFDSIDFDALIQTVKDIGSAFKNDVLPFLKTGVALFGALPGPIKGLAAALAIGSQTPFLNGALGGIGKGVGNIGLGAAGLLASLLPGKLGSVAGSLTAQRVFVVNFPPGFGGLPGVGGAAGAVGGLGVGSALAVGAIALLPVAAAVAVLALRDPKVIAAQDLAARRATVAARGGNPDAVPLTRNGPPGTYGSTFFSNPKNTGLRNQLPSGTGGMSPAERDEAFMKMAESIFGPHGAAAKAFSGEQLKQFRSDPAAAVSLFDDRIRYLAGAQGSGSGSEQYLSVVSRDIAALKTLLPQASVSQAAAITTEIGILEGILKDKKFVVDTPKVNAATTNVFTGKDKDDLVLAAKVNADSQRDAIEASKIAGVAGLDRAREAIVEQTGAVRSGLAAAAAAGQAAAAAIREKDMSPHISVTVSTSTSVSVRDHAIRQQTISRFGATQGAQ